MRLHSFPTRRSSDLRSQYAKDVVARQMAFVDSGGLRFPELLERRQHFLGVHPFSSAVRLREAYRENERRVQEERGRGSVECFSLRKPQRLGVSAVSERQDPTNRRDAETQRFASENWNWDTTKAILRLNPRRQKAIIRSINDAQLGFSTKVRYYSRISQEVTHSKGAKRT